MPAAAVIGDGLRLGGYALAGAEVHHAADADAAVAAWEALGEDVALLVLDPASYETLATRLPERPALVWAVTPS